MATGRPNGRPPKPIERKIAEGNLGKRPLPEIKTVSGVGFTIPRTPTGLKTHGRATWKQLWNAGQTWLNPEQDYTLIKLVCEATDDLYTKRKALQDGTVEEVYLLSNGAWANHPYYTQVKDLRIQITAWLSSLGFSPSDRARLGIAEVKENNPYEELAKRKAEREKNE
jgi:P27 family predicted phage terminase small subunit